MFTTLPLELFVCREVRKRGPREVLVELSIAKVLEQFFFSHEGFSYQRHMIFTTVILFSSMFSEFNIRELFRNLASLLLSLTGHLRSRCDARDNRWDFRHRSRVHLPGSVLPEIRVPGKTLVL